MRFQSIRGPLCHPSPILASRVAHVSGLSTSVLLILSWAADSPGSPGTLCTSWTTPWGLSPEDPLPPVWSELLDKQWVTLQSAGKGQAAVTWGGVQW